MLGNRSTAADYHGNDGLGDVFPDDPTLRQLPVQSQHAALTIIEMTEIHKGLDVALNHSNEIIIIPILN